MRYPKWDTYLEQFWDNTETRKVKSEITIQLFNEDVINVLSHIALEKTLEQIMANIENCKQYVVTILKHLKKVSLILTPKKIEHYTWWIQCLERSRDLHDELHINQKIFNGLLIEARIQLQELEKFQNKVIYEEEKYGENLTQVFVFRNEYQKILEQMNKINIINGTLKEQLESWDLE